MSLLSELWDFLKKRKAFWIVFTVIVLIVGFMIYVGQESAVSTFIEATMPN